MSRELHLLAEKYSAATLALSASKNLGEKEREQIESIQNSRKAFHDGETVIHTGDVVDACYIVRSGWLARQRIGLDGNVVTTNVYLPGDILSIHLGFERTALFDVVALQDSEVAVIDAGRLTKLASENTLISSALDWSGVRAFNIISEHVVSISSRNSTERVLHLLLELWCRLAIVGRATDRSYNIPLTQKEIGEIVGLSTVATNRSIQTLRQSDLITFSDGWVTFANIDECVDYCKFDADYLETFTPVGFGDLQYYKLNERSAG